MAASNSAREIVLVDCPDDVGLIHRITGVLGAHRLNIESNHECVDTEASHFFFRAEVTPAGGAAALPASGALATELARVLPPAARVRVTRAERRPIVVCATREPHCLGELLLLDAVGDLPGRIVAVMVKDGDHVERGQPLVTLEAMKMEHVLIAPFDGTVGGQRAEAVRQPIADVRGARHQVFATNDLQVLAGRSTRRGVT